MTNPLALGYVLILIGLALLIAEVFIPSGGVLFVLAVVALLVGITFTFVAGTPQGVTALLIVFIILPIFGVLWFYIWPKTPLGKKFFLKAPAEDETLAKNPANVELEQLLGRYGRTISPLRPAGITDFDGKRVDTISEGSLIGPEEWVQCIDVRVGTVVVRRVDGPPNFEDMNTTDL